jgi:hypothetical protein
MESNEGCRQRPIVNGRIARELNLVGLGPVVDSPSRPMSIADFTDAR